MGQRDEDLLRKTPQPYPTTSPVRVGLGLDRRAHHHHRHHPAKQLTSHGGFDDDIIPKAYWLYLSVFGDGDTRWMRRRSGGDHLELSEKKENE